MSQYYMAIGNTQQGPFPREHLLTHGLRPETMVWTEGMPQWQRADSIPELASLFVAIPVATPTDYATPSGFAANNAAAAGIPADVNGKKIAAGICGILLGALGIHKFILGFTGAGVTMLLISILSCGIGAGVMHVFGIIEGIIYLTKSDAEFYEIYVVQKKAWF
jgi:TM2 domain-containing membrane protein YozV